MKKITKYLLMLVCLITLSGCGKGATIKESRTIVLNVSSDVTPSFSSNFGTGSYDAETKKYTHTIDYLKDLYIFLSYDDLKTVTVYIPTSDMKEKTITKTVEFGGILDAEVEITVEGVKTLEGLQLSNDLDYSNLQVGKKNTFKFTLPSREQDYTVKFTLPNYREFEIDLSEEDLISGNTKINTIALTTDQVYIDLVGNGYSYKIYSSDTNELEASGDNYENTSSVQHVILPNTTSYYAKVEVNNGKTSLYKIPLNENVTIKVGNNYSYSNGYLNVESDAGYYYSTRMYDKNKGILSNSHYIYSSIESYGLLAEKEGKWYYLDDLASKATKEDWEHRYIINLDDMVEVSFDVTIIDTVTKEIVSTGLSDNININYNTPATLEDNVFAVTLEEMKTGYLEVELYSKDNVKIGTTEPKDISSYFAGDIFSGTITTNEGRTIPYTIPVFVEDLVYNNGKYTYPKQIIDTDVSLLSVKILDANGWINTLSSDDFVMDEEQEVIMGTMLGNETYFELHVGETYTFKYNNLNYYFTVSENDVASGYILVINETIRKVQVKVPTGYYLLVDELNGMAFYPNSEGIVNVPVGEKKYCYASLSNGIAEAHSRNIISDDGSIVEFYPFYIITGTSLQNSGFYEWNETIGTNGVKYFSIYPNAGYTFPDQINTFLMKCDVFGCGENYKIDLNDFEYNEEYKAYYFDVESSFDHIVTFQGYYQMDIFRWSKNYYRTDYRDEQVGDWVYRAFITNGTEINYNDISYTFTNSDSKYLDAMVNYDGIRYELIITETNR